VSAIEFRADTHQYFDGGVELPSVTDIVRFCDYDKVRKARSGNDPFYRDRGTRVHELCADYDFTGEMPQGTGLDGYLKAYADFLRDYRVKEWLYVELVVGSKELGYAGTIDRVGFIDGKLFIPDIKTASVLSKVTLQGQLTGYQEAFLDFCGRNSIELPPPHLAGLQLKRDGKYVFREIESDYRLWESCRYLHSKFWKGTKQ